MRLLSLTLRPYGAYREEAPLRLDPSKRLHIIYGLNESGKTTRRDAITDLLFNFKPTTAYAFAYEMSALRIAASLEVEGDVREIERRKGRTDTLRDASGAPIPEAFMRAMLGGVDRETFRTRFSFGAAELEKGSELLLSSGGDLGYSLYGAALGGADARAVLGALERETETLFKPRGQTMPLNAALSRYTQAVKRVQDLSHPASDLRDIEERTERISQRLREVNAEQGATQQRVAHLQAIVGVIEQYQAYQELQRVIADTRELPRVPDEALDDIRALDERAGELERAERTAREACERIDQHPLHIDEKVLSAATEIDALAADLNGIEKKTTEVRENRVEERARAKAEEYRFLRDRYWPDINDTTLSQRKPERRIFVQAQKAANDHTALLAAKKTADLACEKAERECNRVEGDIPAPTLTADPSALKQAVEAARALGGAVDETLAEREFTLRSDRETLHRRLRTLRFFTDGSTDIADRTLPLGEEIAQADARERALRRREETLREQRARAEEMLTQAQRIVAEHAAAGDIDSAERLQSARTIRGECFAAVERGWQSGDAYEPEKARMYHEAADRADALADQRHDRADALAQARRALTERAAAQTALKNAHEARQAVARERENFAREWKALWEPSGILPDTPEIMNAWLPQAKELITEHRLLEEKETAFIASRTRRDACRAALCVELSSLGKAEAADEQRTLAALTARAARIMKQADEERIRREQAAKHREHAHNEREAAQRERERVNTELEHSEKRKREILTSLHLPTDLQPEIINAALEDIRALFDAYALYQNDTMLLENTRREEQRYREAVSGLITRVAPDLETSLEHAMPTVVKTLQTRLKAARDGQAQRTERDEQTRRAQAEHSVLNASLQAVREQRDALLGSLHVPLEGLTTRIAAADTLRRLHLEAEREERTLRLAARCSIAEIGAETERHGYEGLRRELLREQDALEQSQSERDRLIEERKETLEQRRVLDSSEAAASAQGDALAVAGEIDRHARRYAALVVAQTLLKNEIDRYAQTHQAPILAGASTYFACLTEQRYAGVRIVGADGERPIIEVLHPGGERGVDQLSDGTRDQLYFALRLAVLEEYLLKATALPLVVDDAFLTFDDPRTKAALLALLEFGRKTQVLYFTHHHRVVEIARGIGEDLLEIVEV